MLFDKALKLKSDFLITLCDAIAGGETGLANDEKGIIDRCIEKIYDDYFKDPRPENMPLLEDLYNALIAYEPDKAVSEELAVDARQKAVRIANSLVLYVHGSQNYFNHRTNVDSQNRIVCFDIRDLGKQLKELGMLIVQDAVWNRVSRNRERHVATRYYCDEFHLLLRDKQTAQYSVEIWKSLLRVWDKYKSGYTVGLVYGALDENDQEVYKMIQDLKNDDAPDIALNIQKNYAMRDDVFMDLTGFLDPEVLEKQYGNIIEAGRYDGKLYFLPVTLEIEGLVTNKELIKDGAAGLTFEEFEKLIKDEMNGFSPYDYPNSRAYNKRTFLLSCIDTKRAIEGQKIEFGTDQFRAAAEYAKDNFVYDNEKSVPEDYKNDWTRFRGECYYTRIGDYLDFVCACNKSNASYKIIGTPSTDASGPRFKAIETVSVSATTDVKDGCKKFLNYMFSGAAYNSDDCKFRFIVTNKEIMDRNIEFLTRNNNDEYSKYLEGVKSGKFIPSPGLDKAYGQKEATDDMSESFKESLSSISTYYYEDHTIIEFVDEELAPYYAGDRSLDDAIRYLNDRAAKYVREM